MSHTSIEKEKVHVVRYVVLEPTLHTLPDQDDYAQVSPESSYSIGGHQSLFPLLSFDAHGNFLAAQLEHPLNIV